MRFSSKFLNSVSAVILLSFCFIQFNSFGQEIDSTEKVISLKEVIVEASRSEADLRDMPASVQLLSKERIQANQATVSLEESLRAIPGVFVNNRSNFSQGDRISIRGIGSRSQFGVRGIKMVLDGIPLTFPDGQTQLNTIDIASLGNIEVLKGASSVLYGNSSGGVIYLSSETPSDRRLTITPGYLVGSYGLQKAQLKVSGTLNKFSYLINTNRTYFEGYRDFSTSLFYNLNSLFKYNISERSSVSLVINGNDSPYLLNPGSLDKKTADDDPTFSRQFNKLQGAGKITRQLQSGLNYSLNLDHGQKIEVVGYGILRSLYNPIPGRIIDLDRDTYGLRATYNKKWLFGSASLDFLAGYDFETQTDKRKEYTNEGISELTFPSLKAKEIVEEAGKGPLLIRQNESITGNGFFSKIDLSSSTWTFSIGARIDNYKFDVKDRLLNDNIDNSGGNTLKQINPAIGAVYHHSEAVNFYANYSTGFQTPSANEFGNLPSGAGGFNKDLKPEKLKNAEAGVRGKFWDDKIAYDFTVFFMNIKDQLIPYQVADQLSEEVFYRNAGKTSNSGLETFVSFNPFKSFYVDLGYSINNFRFVDFQVEAGQETIQLKDKRIPGVPTNRFYSSVRYSNKGISAEVNLQQIGSYYTNDFNGSPDNSLDKENFINDSYLQLDLRLAVERKIQRFTPKIFGGINNILDQRYNGSIVPNAAGNRFFEPAPGVNFYLGLSLPITVLE